MLQTFIDYMQWAEDGFKKYMDETVNRYNLDDKPEGSRDAVAEVMDLNKLQETSTSLANDVPEESSDAMADIYHPNELREAVKFAANYIPEEYWDAVAECLQEWGVTGCRFREYAWPRELNLCLTAYLLDPPASTLTDKQFRGNVLLPKPALPFPLIVTRIQALPSI
ncbi:MAG: hypothetical protein Q9170_005010 [Blastenia crenularia]